MTAADRAVYGILLATLDGDQAAVAALTGGLDRAHDVAAVIEGLAEFSAGFIRELHGEQMARDMLAATALELAGS